MASNVKDPLVGIEGFENYWISANGIVYSNVQSNKAFLNGGLYPIRPKEHNRGYLEVGLFGMGTRRWFRIHRLVADAFIPKPLPTYDVDDKEIGGPYIVLVRIVGGIVEGAEHGGADDEVCKGDPSPAPSWMFQTNQGDSCEGEHGVNADFTGGLLRGWREAVGKGS